MMVSSNDKASQSMAPSRSRRLVKLSAWLLLASGVMALGLAYVAATLWMLDDETELALDLSVDRAEYERTLDLIRPDVDYVFHVCCEDSSSAIEDVDGRPARRFVVRDEDPLVKGSHRSEIRFKPNAVNQDVWYRASIHVPEGWEPSSVRVTAMQWHGTRDIFLLEQGRTPPLQLAIKDGRWQILKSWDRRWRTPADGASEPAVSGREVIAEVPLTTGKWIDWAFFVRWSADDDGVLRAWYDGELVLDDRGPNAHRDLIGPYMKAGVYVPDWTLLGPEDRIKERALFFGDVSLSGADDPYGLSAESVAQKTGG